MRAQLSRTYTFRYTRYKRSEFLLAAPGVGAIVNLRQTSRTTWLAAFPTTTSHLRFATWSGTIHQQHQTRWARLTYLAIFCDRVKTLSIRTTTTTFCCQRIKKLWASQIFQFLPRAYLKWAAGINGETFKARQRCKNGWTNQRNLVKKLRRLKISLLER